MLVVILQVHLVDLSLIGQYTICHFLIINQAEMICALIIRSFRLAIIHHLNIIRDLVDHIVYLRITLPHPQQQKQKPKKKTLYLKKSLCLFCIYNLPTWI